MTPAQAQALQDLQTHLDTARRHLAATPDTDFGAYRQLHGAVQALGRLVSDADALLAPLAEELVARQTDMGDQLGDLLDEVGDRRHEIAAAEVHAEMERRRAELGGQS